MGSEKMLSTRNRQERHTLGTLPETRIRFVRHGEVSTDFNGTFYGGRNVPLSPEGEKKSVELADQLATDPIDLVVTSPLDRTVFLAKSLAEKAGAPWVVEKNLRELDRGAWSTKTLEEIETDDPGAIARYVADPESGNGPEGEPESVFCHRVWSTVDRLAAEHPGAHLVAVAHAHVIRAVMRRLEDWSPTQSLENFVPTYGVVDTAVHPDGSGRVISSPPPHVPPPLRPAR